eukprot:7111312-Pyramimonas_sp.AAC.1
MHGPEAPDGDACAVAATGGTQHCLYQRRAPAALSASFSFGAAAVDLAKERGANPDARGEPLPSEGGEFP